MTLAAPLAFAVDGVGIPDSKLAREITELVRETESPLLFHHSSRVYYWGALAGKRRRLKYDPELLYAGAMFHDMGLIPAHSSAHERFEVDGANVARDFLRSHGIAEQDIETVWTAIALHTTPGIPPHMHPVIALVTAGVGRAGASSLRPFQSGHHSGVLRRHQAQARYHVRQRQGRRARRQGSDLQARRLLQCDPPVCLARVKGAIHAVKNPPQ